jgi:hypothetical protein
MKETKNHYDAIDSAAKLKGVGNEVKMIEKFVNYCKAQIPTFIQTAVVPLLLSLCMKDDQRRDHFIATLKATSDYDKNKGDLEWINAQFLASMRGTDWKGNQIPALVNIAMGFEQPQVWKARLLQACNSNRMDPNNPDHTNAELPSFRDQFKTKFKKNLVEFAVTMVPRQAPSPLSPTWSAST